MAALESVSDTDVTLCVPVFSKERRVSVHVFACVFLKVSWCLSVPIGRFRALVSMMSLLSESDTLRLLMILSLVTGNSGKQQQQPLGDNITEGLTVRQTELRDREMII